jgi:hypothetical protein
MMSNTHQVTIPDNWWRPNEALDTPTDCLYGTLEINGYAMHIEAWAITVDDDGLQTTVNSAYTEDFAQLHDAVHADGHFQTKTINGREYIILASPFC